MQRDRPYLIYAYPFDDTSGGIIALHALCERLIAMGCKAAIWPSDKPGSLLLSAVRRPRSTAGYLIRAALRRLRRQPRFPVCFGGVELEEGTHDDLNNAIMVYPEIVAGNPTGAKNIVRWFLHKPGYHRGLVDYGSNEQYFYYQDAFNDPELNHEPDNRLTITWQNPVYKQTNFGERSGRCYLLRKGASRASGLDRAHALVVDDMTHEERAEVFNRCEYLISYDLYSMHSVFAAVCGCVPIIVPEDGLPRSRWFPQEADRLGLAYGWDDEHFARSSRPALLERLKAVREEEDEMLRRFVAKTQVRFGPPATCEKT